MLPCQDLPCSLLLALTFLKHSQTFITRTIVSSVAFGPCATNQIRSGTTVMLSIAFSPVTVNPVVSLASEYWLP